MELRELGRTGLKLSSVGFGASPLGNVFGSVSEEQANASVRIAFQSGINFFDTSPYYGGTLSEKVLGKALKALNVPRSEYIVATKCGRYKEGFDFSAERVTRSVDESLERLQLDYVDILQCHDIEFGSLDQIVNETIPALQKLKEAGKTRFIGITGLPLEVFTYVLDRVPPGTLDVILSYCHHSINDSTLEDIVPYLKSQGCWHYQCFSVGRWVCSLRLALLNGIQLHRNLSLLVELLQLIAKKMEKRFKVSNAVQLVK
uniref:NADP-dependent oxidoreductase domain-containing protein n=1 Tax=Medicago truncatula TaxID=3880 RepID=B7FJP3_MEDTR|nr:unknown [Medicago truncatula]